MRVMFRDGLVPISKDLGLLVLGTDGGSSERGAGGAKAWLCASY
jgi:hypothetical protein